MRIELFLLPALVFVPLQMQSTGEVSGSGSADPGELPAENLSGSLLRWTDIDGDGLEDVVTRDASGNLLLLQNQGTGGFADATASWGLAELGWVRDAHWLRLDGDERPELLAVDGEGELRLFRFEGSTLNETTQTAGLELGFAARSLQWTDVDRDGRTDLVVSGQGERRLLRNLGGLEFESVTLPPGPTSGPAPGALTVTNPTAEDLPGPAQAPEGRLAPTVVEDAEREPARSGRPLVESTPPTGTRSPVQVQGPGSAQPMVASSGVCVESIADQNGGGCIKASSSPQLGRLYPLGTELNVNPAGQVGMGTITPMAGLHVSANEPSVVQASALTNESLIVEEIDAVLGIYSWGGGSWGSALAFGELDATGLLEDKWSIARTTDAAGSSLRFTHGTNASYATNPAHVTFEADGGVGIGTTAAGDHQLRIVKTLGTGSAIDATTVVAGPNSDPVIYGYHKGDGPGVEALTLGGEYAFEGNGMSLTKGAADYALRASNTSGTAAFLDGALEIGAPEAPFFNDVPRIIMDRDPSSGAGRAVFRNGGSFVSDRVVIEAVRSGGTGSAITMRNGSGVALVLDTDHLGSGKSRITTDVVEITGGADLVEHFDAGNEEVEPGTVLVIDADRPGRLKIAAEPYDCRVAGVVSGAGGIDPGLSMGQQGVASGDTAVALTGRVYVKATCEAGPIVPGDRLTTSSLAGVAMRVADPTRADGAVIGKAMSALDEGTGLVLVLVNLQ